MLATIPLTLKVLDMNQFLETGSASLSQSIRRKKILQEHNLETSDSETQDELATDAVDVDKNGENNGENGKGKGTSNITILIFE